MTDPKEKILRDLSDYVNMEEHLRNEDRLLILQAIFEKHILEQKALHLIVESDILLIDTLSKNAYSQLALPLQVGRKNMGYDDLRTIAFTEAVIGYMNLNHLTHKEIKINYRKT